MLSGARSPVCHQLRVAAMGPWLFPDVSVTLPPRLAHPPAGPPPRRPRIPPGRQLGGMHPLFSMTLYTGQQLVLEGLRRWVLQPAKDLDPRRQRASLRALLILLIKTAATGALAAVLDAVLEYRASQLEAIAADADAQAEQDSRPSRLAHLGLLSRAGVAAWKARLLSAIDTLEHHAESYGLGACALSPGRAGGGRLRRC